MASWIPDDRHSNLYAALAKRRQRQSTLAVSLAGHWHRAGKTVVVLALALIVLNAGAQVAVVGSGARSCGSWTNERRTNEVTSYAQTQAWVLGYLRGDFDGQRLIKDPMLHLGPDGAAAVGAWLDKYCAGHPLDSIYVASVELSKELIVRSR